MKKETYYFNYLNLSLGEIEAYEHYDFICDGDRKKIIAELKEESKIERN